MNKKLRLALIVAAAIGSTAAVQANFIINGSFEDVPAFVNSPGNWSYFNSIPGWTPDAGGAGVLEVGRASVYGVTGQTGLNVMELDTTANVVAAQFVAGSAINYTLSFDYALRSGVAQSSGSLEVLWNGLVVSTLSPASTVMQPLSINLLGIVGGNTLKFRGTGTSDSYGALIDNVVLVPEPSTYIAGGLALLPLLLGLRARFQKKA